MVEDNLDYRGGYTLGQIARKHAGNELARSPEMLIDSLRERLANTSFDDERFVRIAVEALHHYWALRFPKRLRSTLTQPLPATRT
jgi:hypothetical protein